MKTWEIESPCVPRGGEARRAHGLSFGETHLRHILECSAVPKLELGNQGQEPGTVEDGSVDLPGSVKQNHLPRPRAPLDAPRDSARPAGNVRILAGTHSHGDVVRGSCDAQTIQDRVARLSGQRGYAALSGVNRQPYARLECGEQAVACRLIQIAGSQGLGDGGAKEEHAGSKKSDSRCCETMTHFLEGLAVVGHA
ncbi:MAG: hypothetical protein ACOX1P_14280 [Thermoguttaceae bacterium]